MIAGSFRRRIFSVEFADLYQEGMIGLLQAQRTYRPSPACRFTTYATHRIRGAILDYLRRLDPLSRQERRSIAESAFSWLPQGYEEPPHVELPGIRARVEAAIDALPTRERYIIREHFWSERSGVELARELGVHKSRIVQLREQALARLRKALDL
jgi:RNA polymerase sigma factor (sigma-70 family)